MPFNAEVDNRRRSEGTRGASFRVSQKHIHLVRSCAGQLPRTVAAILGQKSTGKIASHLWAHYCILPAI
jgi:hypothetical protein